MPFSILKRMDDDFKKEQKNSKNSEMCIKELQNLEKCNDEKKDCTDLFSIWLKCNEKPELEKKIKDL